MTAKQPNPPPPPGSRRPPPPPPPPAFGVQPSRPWPRCYAGLVNGCECPRCKDNACTAGELTAEGARAAFEENSRLKAERRARDAAAFDEAECRAHLAAIGCGPVCRCSPGVASAPGHQHAPRAFENPGQPADVWPLPCVAGLMRGCNCPRCRAENEALAEAMRRARLVAAQLGQPPSPWPLWAVLAIALAVVGACMGAGAAIGVWWAGWHG